MKKHLKGFILGIIITTLLMSTAVGASIKKTIEVALNSVNLTVNGKKINADNILYNGTTYVPLRAVAEALGKEVGWDQKTNTASINDKAVEEVKKPEAEIKTPNKIMDDSLITNASELKEFLQFNFGTLSTVIGNTEFRIDVYENDWIHFPYDYWIMVDYDYDFFNGAMNSIKYTNQEKETLKKELKQHMEELGKVAIKKMPDEKLLGGYYKSWYKYPNIREGLESRQYFTWNNYGDYDFLSNISAYEQTKPSVFRWYDKIDDKL